MQCTLSALEKAKSWSDCHRVFLKYRLTMKPHGNGLMIKTVDGRHSIKASGLDRSISKTKLEKRFGSFTPTSPELLQSDNSVPKYTAAPLHKEPDRDKLREQFKEAMAKRQAALTEINQQDARLFSIHKQGWEKKWAAIKKAPMLRMHRQKVMKELKTNESTERASLRKQMKQKREDVRNQYPFNSWSKFLRHLSGQGNETALAILRSKRKEVAVDKSSIYSVLFVKAKSSTLPAVVDEIIGLLRRESPGIVIKSPMYTIDGKGTVIMKLPDGGSIRDAGSAIHFSAYNENAKKLAGTLATSRWGHLLISENGYCMQSPMPLSNLNSENQKANINGKISR